MTRKKTTLAVAILMCIILAVTAFVGCDDQVETTTYKVTFDSTGGSSVVAAEGKVDYEPVPVRDGYTFDGWYTTSDYSGERIAFPYEPEADVTLYAKWTEAVETQEYTVSFDSAGGSKINSVKGTVESEPIPVKDGYVFAGWYKYGVGTKVKFPYTPTENVILVATWQEYVISASTVVTQIVNAAKNQGMFSNTDPFGGSLNVTVGDINVDIDLYMDPTDEHAVRMGLKLSRSGSEIVALYADDTNAYALSSSGNKRFVNVNLSEFLTYVSYPSDSQVGSGYDIMKLALNMIFKSASENSDGTYTLTGNLDGIVTILNLFTDIDIPQEILNVISQITLQLNADIKDNALNSLQLTAVTQLGNLSAKVNEFRLSNNYDPGIEVPAKDAAGFDESYLLNFTLEGSFTLKRENEDYTLTDLAKYDYELRVDFNIAEALLNCMSRDENGTLTFDISQIFNTCDSRIYFNLYHQCDETCSEYCSSKTEQSRGSILTLAYSPEDFGNTNVYASINAKYLLPSGFIDSLLGDGLESTIMSILNEYVGLTIDPAALLIQGEDTAVPVSEELSMIDVTGVVSSLSGLPEGINILDVVFDVANFVRSLNLTEGYGLRVGTGELMEIFGDLESVAGANIANILYPFLGGVDCIDFKVDKAVYGDPETNTMDIFRKFMIISDELADLKSFGTLFKFAKEYDFVRGNDGNIILTSGDISTHDAEGNPIKLTKEDVQLLLTEGTAKYNFVDVYGNTGTGAVEIVKVIGMDYDIVGEEQQIRVISSMADGGTISALLAYASMMLSDIGPIPGSVFETGITITEMQSVEFYQAEDDADKIDETREYLYGDKINPVLTAKVTFVDGTQKEVPVYPDEDYTKYLNKTKLTLYYFGDFDFVYTAYGQTVVKHVNTADQLISDEAVEVSVTEGEKYQIGNSVTATYYSDATQTSTSTVKITGTEENMTDIAMDGVVVESFKAGSGIMSKFAGINISFTEAGIYEIDIKFNNGYSRKYIFNVEEAIDLPGYVAETTVEGVDTIKVAVSRSDQYGDGLNAKVQLQMPDQEGVMQTLSADDYYIYVLDAEGNEVKLDSIFLEALLVKPYEFYVKIVNEQYFAQTVINMTANVNLLATDYKDALITVAQVRPSSENYSLSLESSFDAVVEEATGSGKYVMVTPICPEDKAISGLLTNSVVKIIIDGGEEIVLESGDFAFGTANATTNKFSAGSLKFTEDGISAKKYQYLQIKGTAVLEAIAAAESTVEISIEVRATNYENVTIATAATVIELQ